MSAKAQEENVKKLVALGFSKTKAQKALKDTGNSFPRAKEMLERQQQAAEKEAAQQEIIRKRQEEEEEKKRRHLAEQKLLAAASNGLASASSAVAATSIGVPAPTGNLLSAGSAGGTFQFFLGLNHTAPVSGAFGGDVHGVPQHHPTQPHHFQHPQSQALMLQPPPHVHQPSHVRLHPCMVQYKSCRYGRYCLLKDLPGDACINHFHGNCIYGSSCRHRHHIDGVDIRHYVPSSAAGLQPPIDDGVLMRQEDGGLVVHTETIAGGVQLAEVYYPNDHPMQHTHDPSGSRAQPLPPEYQWNAVRGSEPSYSDPVQSTASIWAPEIGASLEGAPTPFLDKLRLATPAAVQRSSRQVVHAHDNHSAQLRVVRFGEPGYLAHPCILQCGGCKYGDHCMHASRPADVCVFYLNGRCNYEAHQCRFRHDDSLTMIAASSMAALAQRTQQGGGGSPSVAVSSVGAGGQIRGSPNLGSSSSTASPPVTFVLKPNAVVGGMSMWSLNESLASREQALLEKQYAPPPPPHRMHDAHLSMVGTSGPDGAASAQKQQLRTPTLGALYGNTGGPSSSSVGGGVSSPPGSPQLQRQQQHTHPQQTAEEERRAFGALCEVFPNVDPALLLHALRMANGDRRLVANVLAETHANDNDNDLEALLGAALAEEGAQWNAGCSSDALLSLLTVFPNLDVPVVEDALRRANNNVPEAFSALVRSTEHISTEGFAGNSWGALGGAPGTSAADQLKLQRLFVMYPELPQEVVQDCFLAANGSTQGCIEALTNLVSEVRTVQERMEEGNRAMRKELSPPSQSPTTNAAVEDDVPTGSFTVSSDNSGGGGGGFSVTSSTSPILPSQTDLYHEVAQEAAEQGDWRRVRERAYFVNHCRIQLLSMAASCFARGDGRGAKQLSQKAAALGIQYRRLNMIAMRALEEERNGVHSVSMLDLHGFHVDEAVDVLHRRIQLCLMKRVPRLRVVIGRGLHSQRGRSSVFPAVLQELSSHPHLVACCRVTSVKQAFIEVQLLCDAV